MADQLFGVDNDAPNEVSQKHWVIKARKQQDNAAIL